MSLSDLAVELLNEAKLAPDAKTKQYKLEQIKEIALHRDDSVLGQLINDITSFKLEKSSPLRRFLIKFIEEACGKSNVLFVELVDICSYFVHDDSPNEGVLRDVASVLTKLYGDICLHIIRTSSDGKTLWNDFQTVCTKLIDSLSPQSLSDITKATYFRFTEECILFGLPCPNAPVSLDPRKVKIIKKANVLDVPFHHSFLNPKQIEQDAEALLNKLLLWASKGGPQGHAFSPNLIAQLLASISAVATQRPSKLTLACKVLMLFAKDRLAVFRAMGSEAKEQVSLAFKRVVFATTGIAELQDTASKLHEAIEVFENDLREKGDDSALRKRSSFEMSAHVSIDRDDEASADLRLLAREAVDVAETVRKSSRTAAAVSTQSTAELSLHTDLATLPTDMKDKLVSIAFVADGAMVKSDAIVSAVQKPPTVHCEMSYCSLHRLLDNYTSPTSYRSEAQPSIAKMIVRVVLLMAYTDLKAGRSLSLVGVFSSIPHALRNRAELVAEVLLPRSIWITISFCVHTVEQERTATDRKPSKRVEADITSLANMLFAEMYSRSKQLNEEQESRIYSDSLLVLLSRCIEKNTLRSLMKQTLLSAPSIPQTCMYMISVIALRSSTDAVSGEKSRLKDMLALLCDLTREAQSRRIRDEALQSLLWFSVSEDFDVRIRAISYLTKDLLDKTEGLTSSIMSFAMHAAVNSLGLHLFIAKSNSNNHNSFNNTSDNDAMQIDDVNSTPVSMYDIVNSYDNGKCFGGSFSLISKNESKERIKEHVKRHVHLLGQIILSHFEILRLYIEIFAVCEYICVQNASGDLTVEANDVVLAEIVKEVISSEIATCIPVVLQSLSAEDVFDMVSCVDTYARQAVVYVLLAMFKDDRIPPSDILVKKVRAFAQEFDEEFRNIAYVPIIGGMSTEEIESSLAGYVRKFGASPEGLIELERIFTRIYKARPPPLSKASLVIALHRIDIEMYEQKPVLDSIEICLRNKTDFKADVLKEALTRLLDDDVPVLPLMRTCIRAAQTYPEIRVFVLNEAIPRLVAKQVWISSSRVWEGVLLANKILIQQKEGDFQHKAFDSFVRALLGLPSKQLLAVLSTTPKLKTPLKLFFNSLRSSEEKDLVIAGAQVMDEESLAKSRLEKLTMLD